jgi:tetratricopeptide (TPR) repeat protein
MAKRWQNSEVSYLRRYGTSKPVDELAKRFKTDARTVRAKLAEVAPARAKRAEAAPVRARKVGKKAAAKPARPAARPQTKRPSAKRQQARPAPARVKAKAKVRKASPAPARVAGKPVKKAAVARRPAPPARPSARPPARPAARPPARPPARPIVKKAAPAPARAKAPEPAKKAPPAPLRPPIKKAEAPRAPEPPDAALIAYTDALKAMHKQDWARAVKLFEKVAHDEDRPEIAARARQYLAAAHQRLEEADAKPGQEDAYLKAVFEKNRGNLAAALEICRRGGREKRDERFAYLAAAIHVLENRLEEAAEALGQAVELNPKNRIHAYHDADFAELRKDRELRQLFDLP